MDRGSGMAREIGHAEGVALDLAASDFGLGRRPVTVVALFPREDTLAGLHFAQARGVPYTGISGGVDEIGSEVAAYTQRAWAARRCSASNGSWVPYPPAHGTHGCGSVQAQSRGRIASGSRCENLNQEALARDGTRHRPA